MIHNEAYEQVRGAREKMFYERLQNVLGGTLGAEIVAKLREVKFEKHPAAAKYHNNFEGGLIDHCLKVEEHLLALNTVYQFATPEQCSKLALIHDFHKVGNYTTALKNVKKGDRWIQDEVYVSSEIPDKIVGSGNASAILAMQWGIPLTNEEIIALQLHHGLYDTGTSGSAFIEYNVAIGKNKLAFFLHMADMIASKYYESVM